MVRLSFSRLKSVALIRFAHLLKADVVRTYFRMISLLGLSWLNSSTNCFLCSSLNVRLARLSSRVFPSLLSSREDHYNLVFSVHFSVANPNCNATVFGLLA